MTRWTMWSLLAVVATAAAVLSFSALRDLADLCGFHRSLSWLLPVVVDAGAGCGCLIWLGTSSPARALRFARALTWVLLASSVMGNAVVHYLAAYSLRPAWWLVVLVSAVAPSVLGSVIHLAVLVGRDVQHVVQEPATDGISESTPAPVPSPPVRAGKPAPIPPNDLLTEEVRPKRVSVPADTDKNSAETKARALLAANPGIGRRKLMVETGLSEYEARRLLEQSRAPRNGVKVLEEAR